MGESADLVRCNGQTRSRSMSANDWLQWIAIAGVVLWVGGRFYGK